MKDIKFTGKPIAIMRGGFRDGWCYHVEDLERQVKAAERMNSTFDYRPTNEYVPHPEDATRRCQVWQRI
jgi:hypothetical protein